VVSHGGGVLSWRWLPLHWVSRGSLCRGHGVGVHSGGFPSWLVPQHRFVGFALIWPVRLWRYPYYSTTTTNKRLWVLLPDPRRVMTRYGWRFIASQVGRLNGSRYNPPDPAAVFFVFSEQLLNAERIVCRRLGRSLPREVAFARLYLVLEG